MTPDEAYTFLVLVLKAGGLFALALIIFIVVAIARTPEYPEDDGEIL